jgi:hypothetical protein
MDAAPVPAFTPFRSGGGGFAYNETAFRHFLEIERRRARKSRRLLLLALVTAQGRTQRHRGFTAREAAAIFTALGAAARDIDLVGWFRENRVIAVLMAQPARPADNVHRIVAGRIERALQNHGGGLPPLRVRVVALRAQGDTRPTRASSFP